MLDQRKDHEENNYTMLWMNRMMGGRIRSRSTSTTRFADTTSTACVSTRPTWMKRFSEFLTMEPCCCCATGYVFRNTICLGCHFSLCVLGHSRSYLCKFKSV